MPKPKALLIAYAVHESGVREVIGLDVGEVESGAFYVEFSRSLHKRGLGGVRLAISDQHEGLNGTIARVLKVSVAALRRPVHQRHGDALPPRSANLVAAALRRCSAPRTATRPANG